MPNSLWKVSEMNSYDLNAMTALLNSAGYLLRFRDEAANEHVFSTPDSDIFCKVDAGTGSFRFTNDRTGELLAQGKGADMFRVLIDTLTKRNEPVELECPVTIAAALALFRQGQFKPFSKADSQAYAGCDGDGFIYSSDEYEIIADVNATYINFGVMVATEGGDTASWSSTIDFTDFERIV